MDEETTDKGQECDVVLGDGREIRFDMRKISLREYRQLFDRTQPAEEEDAVLARVAGLTVEEYRGLALPDWRRLTVAFFERARELPSEKN